MNRLVSLRELNEEISDLMQCHRRQGCRSAETYGIEKWLLSSSWTCLHNIDSV